MMDTPFPDRRAPDLSGWGILLSNALTIVVAVYQNWDLRPLLIVYWSQSVIIGVFNFLRMIWLQKFTTEGLTSNGRPVAANEKGKWSTAIFFALHYGIFHVVYAVFLFGFLFENGPGAFDGATDYGWGWLLLGILGFLAGHAFSFRTNVAADLRGCPNLGTMMFLPYARIIPMHLTMILGMGWGSQRSSLLLFLVLKTIADWLMHVVEHRALQSSPSR